MKRRNTLLLFSTVISLFGVFVASFATLAWFRISYSQPSDLSDPGEMVTGESDIEIAGVTGYKWMWDENSDGTEAETGRVISSYKEGPKTLANNYGNTDQDIIEPIDHADQGVGYYILGDETWAAYAAEQFDRQGGEEWRYSSSLKMDERYSYNYAAALNVQLKEGESIQINRHTYSNADSRTSTIDSALPELSSESHAHATMDPETSRITIKQGQSGTYNIFINLREQICLNFISDDTSDIPVLAKAHSPIRRDLDNATEACLQVELHLYNTGLWEEIYGNNRPVYAYIYDISFVSESNITHTLSPEALNALSIPGITWSKQGERIEADAECHIGAENPYWYKLPWFVERASFQFYTYYDSTKVWFRGSNNVDENAWSSGVRGNYEKIFYGETQDGADKWYEVETGNHRIRSHYHTGTDTGCTDGVPQYAVSYYKTNTDGTSLGVDSPIKKYTYYSPKDSFKSGGGQAEGNWRGWHTSEGEAFEPLFLTSNITVIGIYVESVYFELFIVKKDHEGNYADPIPFGPARSYYVDSHFDPETIFGFNECAASYPGYDYPASPSWKIGDIDGDAYDKSTFDDFGFTEETATKLYLTIEEKTITLTRKWVKLKYNGYSDSALDLRVGEIDPTGTPLTVYGDTLAYPEEPSPYLGEYSLTGYGLKQENTYWTDVGAIDSTNLGTPHDETQYFREDQTIYYLYLPNNAYITYEYHLFITDAVSHEETEYNEFTPSDTIYKRHYNDGAFVLADHAPRDSWKVNDTDAHAAYYFTWDENYYTDSGCTSVYAFSAVPIGLNRTLHIKLKTTAETMYFDSKSTMDDWNKDLENVYVHVYDVCDAGDIGDLPCEKLADGIHRFYMTTGVNFMMYNGAGGNANTRYTSNINLASNDSNSKPRGHCNCIKNTSTLDGDYHVTWVWTNYFGSTIVGSINRGATAYFTSSTKNTEFVHGDGTINMYVYENAIYLEDGDTFALRFNNHGVYYWYDYDNLDASSRKYVYEPEAEYAEEEIGGAVWGGTDRHAIKIKYTGYYNMYFTAQGTVSLASVPSGKGEGYYLMPFDSEGIYGNNLKSSFNNALKMRMLEIDKDIDGNVAFYKGLTVTSYCKSFYIKSFIDSVENGPMESLGPNQYALMGQGEDAGVFTFKSEGTYNIYLRRSNSSSTPVYTIYITENKTDGNFFSMNEIAYEHDENLDGDGSILEQRTTMVLEIKFRSPKHNGSYNIGADIMRTGLVGSPKLSKYLDFGIMYSESSIALGGDCFGAVREASVYNTKSSFSDDSAMAINKMDPANITDNGYHYLYVFMDYNVGKSVLEANRANLTNDFKVVLKARG